MTHIAQITKQATSALNAYAANAGVPADKIPALRITQTGAHYTITAPGSRVAATIRDAISIDGFTAACIASYVEVKPIRAAQPDLHEGELDRYMLRNGFDRNDI